MAATGGAAGWDSSHAQRLGRRPATSSRASLACPAAARVHTENQGRRWERTQKRSERNGWCMVADWGIYCEPEYLSQIDPAESIPIGR
uniref:Uncharacterized protein n=1 Tax=Oryza punctata TaxID=4537 RepID=A0A0E0K1D5_ORYPU